LAIDDAAIEAGRLGVPVLTINEPFFDSAGHLVQNISPNPPIMLDAVAGKNFTTLSGTAEVNSIVSISDGGKPVGTATAGADGTWSFQASLSGKGIHSFTETSNNGSGNTIPSSAVTLFAGPNHSLVGGTGNTC